MRFLAGCIAALALVPLHGPAHWQAPGKPAAPRILYSSDWSGTTEIYAVDPSGKLPVAQVTFGRPPSCSGQVFVVECGFTDPMPSPDGRWVLYRDVGYIPDGSQQTLWIARADGGAPRVLARRASRAAWSPDS